MDIYTTFNYCFSLIISSLHVPRNAPVHILTDPHNLNFGGPLTDCLWKRDAIFEGNEYAGHMDNEEPPFNQQKQLITRDTEVVSSDSPTSQPRLDPLAI